jgi:hypothetical protein
MKEQNPLPSQLMKKKHLTKLALFDDLKSSTSALKHHVVLHSI